MQKKLFLFFILSFALAPLMLLDGKSAIFIATKEKMISSQGKIKQYLNCLYGDPEYTPEQITRARMATAVTLLAVAGIPISLFIIKGNNQNKQSSNDSITSGRVNNHSLKSKISKKSQSLSAVQISFIQLLKLKGGDEKTHQQEVVELISSILNSSSYEQWKNTPLITFYEKYKQELLEIKENESLYQNTLHELIIQTRKDYQVVLIPEQKSALTLTDAIEKLKKLASNGIDNRDKPLVTQMITEIEAIANVSDFKETYSIDGTQEELQIFLNKIRNRYS